MRELEVVEMQGLEPPASHLFSSWPLLKYLAAARGGGGQDASLSLHSRERSLRCVGREEENSGEDNGEREREGGKVEERRLSEKR